MKKKKCSELQPTIGQGPEHTLTTDARRELGDDEVPKAVAQCVDIEDWQLTEWIQYSTRASKWMWDGHEVHIKIYCQDDDVKITQWNKYCKKSVWMCQVKTNNWVKICDRVPVDDRNESPSGWVNFVVLMHREDYVTPHNHRDATGKWGSGSHRDAAPKPEMSRRKIMNKERRDQWTSSAYFVREADISMWHDLTANQGEEELVFDCFDGREQLFR